MRETVVWLGDADAGEVALVGAKVANLSQLANAYRVPLGFCVTAAAMDNTNMDVSVDLRPHIEHAYARLAQAAGEPTPAVAVRSSATDEDSAAASFAGQHDTYLNVRGADAVVQSIARCWQSLYAPRALEYRRQRGLSIDGARLAVLVQRLVRADASAVVFSTNPVTKSADEVVLTSTWGLGESLVGGSVSPDTFVMRKPDLEMVTRVIATKRRMTVPGDGGAYEIDVPLAQQAEPAVDDDQVRAAARLALEVEQLVGWPLDMECAWENRVLYVLQCRPITGLGAAGK
jgi:phosphoenolpyruvate synthase/pyruvate phosphate dikinase